MDKPALLSKLRDLGLTRKSAVLKLAEEGQYDLNDSFGRKCLIVDLTEYIRFNQKLGRGSDSVNLDAVIVFRDELVSIEGIQINTRGAYRLDRMVAQCR